MNYSKLRDLLEKSYMVHNQLNSIEVNKLFFTGDSFCYQINAYKQLNNIKQDKSQQIMHTYYYNNQKISKDTSLVHQDSSVIINQVSQSGNRRAIVKKIEDTHYLELYEKSRLTKVQKLSFLGVPCTSKALTRYPIIWSQNEDKF